MNILGIFSWNSSYLLPQVGRVTLKGSQILLTAPDITLKYISQIKERSSLSPTRAAVREHLNTSIKLYIHLLS